MVVVDDVRRDGVPQARVDVFEARGVVQVGEVQHREQPIGVRLLESTEPRHPPPGGREPTTPSELMLGHLVALVVRLLAVEIISLRLPRGKWGLGRSVRLASQ